MTKGTSQGPVSLSIWFAKLDKYSCRSYESKLHISTAFPVNVYKDKSTKETNLLNKYSMVEGYIKRDFYINKYSAKKANINI